MQTALVQHYLNRAIDMFDAMVLLQNDAAFKNSSALLAIHSAISYSDALRAGLDDEKLSFDHHEKAADALQALLSARKIRSETGASHLRFLLSRKNVVAYSTKRMDRTDYEALITKAERFAKWADTTARELKIAGWKYGDR